MKANPELREKMWELCYDLLPDDERATLVATIKSDPQAARLYAEVRLQADLVGFAAKVEDSSLIFSPEGKESPDRDLGPAAARRKAAASGPADPLVSTASTRRSWVVWLPAVAALLLVGLMGYGAYRPLSPRGQLAKFVVAEISIPGSMPEGLSSKVVVRSSSLAGEPLAAELDVRLVDAGGDVLHHEVVPTDSDGLAAIMLPGPSVQTGVRIEATARQRDGRGELLVEQAEARLDKTRLAESAFSATAALPVEQQPPLVYYMPDRPSSVPGEAIRYAKYNVSRFGLQMETAEVEDLGVQDPVADESLAEKSAAGGQPEAASRGREGEELTRVEGLRKETVLRDNVLRDLERQSGLQQRSRSYADGAAQGAAGTSVPGLGASGSGGGGLGGASGLDRAAGGEPYSMRTKDADPFAKQLRQQADEKKQLEKSVGRADQQFYDRGIAEAVILEPGAPVPFDVPAKLSGKNKNLRVQAVVRGVLVASAPVADPAQSDMQENIHEATPQTVHNYALDVPPEADGEIQVQLVDASQSPPLVVRQQTVFRRPSRQLKLALDDPQNQFQPGQTVKLRLQVLNEHDQPEVATLGVRVWNEADVQASGRQPALVADVMRSTSELSGGSGYAQTRGQMLAMGTAEKLEVDKLAMGELRGLESAKKGDGLTRNARGARPAEAAPSAPAPAPAQPAPAATAPAATPDVPLAEAADPAQATLAFGNDPAGMAETRLYAAVPPAAAILGPSEPFVVSNHAAVARQSRALAAESEQAWQAWRSLVGRVLVVGGIVALGGLMLLFLVRMPVRAASGTLTLLAATASLIVGAFWISGDNRGMQIAAAPTIARNGRVDEWRFRENLGDNLRHEDAILLNREDDANAALPANEPVDRFAQADASSPAESVRFKQSPAADFMRNPAASSAGFGAAAPADAAKSAETASPPGFTVPADSSGSPETKITAGAAGLEAPANSPQATGRGGGFAGGGKPGGALAPAGAGQPALPPGIADAEKDAAGKPLPARPSAQEPPANRASRRATVADRPAQDAPAPAGPPPAPAPEAPALQALEADKPDGLPDGGALAKSDSAKSEPAKSETAAPAALYFNPRLATDADGYATIEFQMPDVESDYRVLIDAFGQGRIGSAELLIMCRK